MSVKSNTNAASTIINEKKEFNMKGSIESIIATLKEKASEIFAYAKALYTTAGYNNNVRNIVRAFFTLMLAILLLKIWAVIMLTLPVIGLGIVYVVAYGAAERMIVRVQTLMASDQLGAARNVYADVKADVKARI